MSSKIFGLLLIGFGALAWFAKQTVDSVRVIFNSLKIYEVRTDAVLFQLNLLFYNPLFKDVKIDSLSGEIYMMGRYIAHMESELNQLLYAKTQSSLAFYFKATPEQLGQALWDNIQTGDVRTLTIKFDGTMYLAGVPVPVKKTFTYDQLFNKKK